MTSYIVVHPLFEAVWPQAADYLHQIWDEQGQTEYIPLEEDDNRALGEVIDEPGTATRLVSLGVPVTDNCIELLTGLQEAAVMTDNMYRMDKDISAKLQERGVTTYDLCSEGFWSQSVAELALGLTIGALREIPQKHMAIIDSQDSWDWDYIDHDVSGAHGYQGVGDSPDHTHGTIAGKRVRIVGVGNIGSRYADFVNMLGADVAAYDPYADEPCFHRTGTRREFYLNELVRDAEIFAPMVPLTDSTRGLITQEHIDALPEGSLLLLVTRAGVCDMDAVRERVLAGEIALAADVFDDEPLPLDDPLLGRDNVVHTPHIAGRTRHANKKWAEYLAAQFKPID